MAKSENPLDVYRRQQRKKELKKNKNTRIKARDAKVAATRAVDEVKAEISLLERKRDRFGKSRGGKDCGDHDEGGGDDLGGLDSNETKKLERLRKELRIVTAESARRKELHEQAEREKERQFIAAQKTVEGVQKLNESKYSVQERFASVYYDEQMNPFGAPPPGKPKLYWLDFDKKTTTMNARMAVVPSKLQHKFDTEMKKQGNDDVADNHAISSGGRKRRWDEPGHLNHQMMAREQHAPPSHPPPFQKTPPLPPPPLPPPVVPPPPPPPPPPPKAESSQPLMPAPSKAVIRAAKRNKTSAIADIWASSEEIQYEQRLGVEIEGAIDEQQQQQQQQNLPRWLLKKQKRPNEADVNDPINPSSEGYGEYRNREQIERQSREVSLRQKEQLDHANQHYLASQQQKKQQQHLIAAENAWYYRDNSSGAIQGPFSGEQMMGWRNAGFFPPTTPVRFGHGNANEEFVALSEIDFTAPPIPVAPSPPLPLPPPPPLDSNTAAEFATVAYPSVDDAITEETTLEFQPNDDRLPHFSEVELAEPPPSDDEDNDEDHAEVDICLPPTSDDEEVCIPPHTDDEQDESENIDDDAANGNDLPAYPPTENDYDNEVEYPDTSLYAYPNTDDAYGEVQQYDTIPAIAPYPSEDTFGRNSASKNSETKDAIPPSEEKKKYDGDKAVVSFMPSHLRTKRAVPKKPPMITKVATADASKKSSVTDDYDKFMSEISALK